MKSVLRLTVLSALLVSAAGCGSLVSGLRKDLDDQEPYYPPIAGGKFDRGFLSESTPEGGSDRYNAVGHSERGPASVDYGAPGAQSWVSQDQYDSARRDTMRDFQGDPNSAIPPTKRLYKNGARATRADFVDESPNEGSLWASDGQTNYYFTKNKVRGTGDIVTLKLEPDVVKDIDLEVRRKLNQGEIAREVANAQARIRAKVMSGDNGDPSELAMDRAPAKANDGKDKKGAPPQDREIPTATEADIDLSKALEVKAGDTMLAEIIERYPNGNYKIRGSKKIPYRSGAPRQLNLLGIVRAQDIAEDDTINSGKLYEYRLEATR